MADNKGGARASEEANKQAGQELKGRAGGETMQQTEAAGRAQTAVTQAGNTDANKPTGTPQQGQPPTQAELTRTPREVSTMSGGVPRDAVNPGPLPSAAAGASSNDELVDAVAPRAFTLTHENGRSYAITAGLQKLPRMLLDHWYAKAHGVQLAKDVPRSHQVVRNWEDQQLANERAREDAEIVRRRAEEDRREMQMTDADRNANMAAHQAMQDGLDPAMVQKRLDEDRKRAEQRSEQDRKETPDAEVVELRRREDSDLAARREKEDADSRKRMADQVRR